jgi:hypothetical protein
LDQVPPPFSLPQIRGNTFLVTYLYHPTASPTHSLNAEGAGTRSFKMLLST